jgi:hypothetical protein
MQNAIPMIKIDTKVGREEYSSLAVFLVIASESLTMERIVPPSPAEIQKALEVNHAHLSDFMLALSRLVHSPINVQKNPVSESNWTPSQSFDISLGCYRYREKGSGK